MGNSEKKDLTDDADSVLWPWLKEKARKLRYGKFDCTVDVHAGQIQAVHVSKEVESKRAIPS